MLAGVQVLRPSEELVAGRGGVGGNVGEVEEVEQAGLRCVTRRDVAVIADEAVLDDLMRRMVHGDTRDVVAAGEG